MENRYRRFSERPETMTILEIVSRSRPRKKVVLPLFKLAATRASDYVTTIRFGSNHLDDDVGQQVADLIEKSEVLTDVRLHANLFTAKTMLAIARALQINNSVRTLHLYDNIFCNTPSIRTMLIGALWINPDRPIDSDWRLFGPRPDYISLKMYKEEAKKLPHPSLQIILIVLNRKMTIRKSSRLTSVRRIES
ncbi:MAG: hypothetical protein ACOVQN_04100 [Exiguobacterium sp.]